jgi:ferredoxin
MNDADYVEVTEVTDYPELEINDAIKCCPTDCIYWEEE